MSDPRTPTEDLPPGGIVHSPKNLAAASIERALDDVRRELEDQDEEHPWPREGYSLDLTEWRGWPLNGLEAAAREHAHAHPEEFGNTLLEELGEVLSAKTRPYLRHKLTQLAAVAVQMIRHIDQEES